MRITTTTIALLGLWLSASGVAHAADAAIVNLSCDGTFGIVGDQTGTREPVTKMGLVVNLAEHTVLFDGVLAHIDKIDAATISFNGEGDVSLPGTGTLGKVSVFGEIDRVTGAVSATTANTSAMDNKVVGTENYDLVCRVTKRLF